MGYFFLTNLTVPRLKDSLKYIKLRLVNKQKNNNIKFKGKKNKQTIFLKTKI